MSSLTGYLTSSGIDLSFIFQSGNSGLTTGYVIRDGRDLGSIFKARTSYTAALTGLTIQSGADISTLFDGAVSESLPLLIPGCCMWLDATDISTIDLSGTSVKSWVDKSINGFVFNQTTNENRPTYTANGQNSLATITFDRLLSQYLVGPSNFSIGTSSYSLFVVCNITLANTATCGIFNKSLYGNTAGRIIMTQDPGLAIQYQHTSGALLTAGSASYTVGNYRILELIVNQTANADSSYQNGTLVSSLSVADSTNYTDTTNVMLIGAYNNSTGGANPPAAGYYLSGNVAEIVAYKGDDLTAANRQKVEGYLAWKWGFPSFLPAAHPYRYSSPSIASISGCCLWLDASDASKVSLTSSKVSRWTDKSVNGFLFNQNTAGFRPVNNTNTQNGLKTITFSAGGSTYLVGPTAFSIGTSSFSLFVVCNVTLGGGDSCGIFNKSILGAQDGRILMVQDGGNLGIQYTHPGDVFLPTTPNTYPVGNYRILELIVNRTEGMDYAYQNGSLLTSLAVSDSTNYTNTTNVMLIGGYPDGNGTLPLAGFYLSGNLAEILAYKGSDMTTANRQRIEGYLAWKWGIQTYLPTGHPYLGAAPT